ncbi:hypothetical protein [Polyangium sp. y55x31]|uniref:hypothetical protein n=1 Tax=Polyangium sp. y55x31 TaxID=3042688 RepID=UPI002482AF61|nr:hypothetical protein [Polyangium sp. y55x31]MDI1477884.1 hypothetical protein [Polyangium sp. y55x31]
MKATSLVLVALFALALAGCEDKAKPSADPSAAKPAESAKPAASAKPASTGESGGW